MATFSEAMHSVLQTLHVLEDKRTQTDIMLDLLKENWTKWVHCDVFRKYWIRDHRNVKYKLTMRGYIIHTIQPRKEKRMCDEWTYVLIGRICPPLREHRWYLKDFSLEEIKSELFRRDQMSTIYVNEELYDIIKR